MNPSLRLSRWATYTTLGFMAIYSLTRAVAYMIPDRNIQDPLRDASFDGVLLPAYVGLWAVAGLWCLWDMRAPTIRGFGPVMVISMMVLWGTAYFLGWLVELIMHGESPLWWQTSLTYWAPAAWTLALLVGSSIPRWTDTMQIPQVGVDDD